MDGRQVAQEQTDVVTATWPSLSRSCGSNDGLSRTPSTNPQRRITLGLAEGEATVPIGVGQRVGTWRWSIGRFYDAPVLTLVWSF